MRHTIYERFIMSIYSFGIDSPIKFDMADQDAEFYNLFTKKFYETDNPEGLRKALDAGEVELEAYLRYNRICGQIAISIIHRDSQSRIEDIHGDFLVKN
jgi:hypothetical protein